MDIFKDFKDAAKAYEDMAHPPAPPKNHMPAGMIGDSGTVEEFRDALKEVTADFTAKQNAYLKRKNKITNKTHDAYNAFSEAYDALNYFKKEFVSGALEGFYFGRNTNLQTILSAPDEFNYCSENQKAHSFAADVFIEALQRSLNPEKVPEFALATLTRRNKQIMLNDALEKLTAEPQDKKTAACIEALRMYDAGAPVPDEKPKIILRPAGQPGKLVLSPKAQ